MSNSTHVHCFDTMELFCYSVTACTVDYNCLRNMNNILIFYEHYTVHMNRISTVSNVTQCLNKSNFMQTIIGESFNCGLCFLFKAFLSDHFFITTFPDRPKLDYGYFIKRPPLGEALKRLEKMSVWEPKV